MSWKGPISIIESNSASWCKSLTLPIIIPVKFNPDKLFSALWSLNIQLFQGLELPIPLFTQLFCNFSNRLVLPGIYSIWVPPFHTLQLTSLNDTGCHNITITVIPKDLIRLQKRNMNLGTTSEGGPVWRYQTALRNRICWVAGPSWAYVKSFKVGLTAASARRTFCFVQQKGLIFLLSILLIFPVHWANPTFKDLLEINKCMFSEILALAWGYHSYTTIKFHQGLLFS